MPDYVGAMTINDVPVLLDVDSAIETAIMSRLRAFTWPSLKPIENKTSPFVPSDYGRHRFELPYGDVPMPRINEYINPTGLSRYGRGMLLLDRVAMQSVAENGFGFIGNIENGISQWGDANQPLAFSISYDNLTFARNVYCLTPMSVSAYNHADLWLVPIVDVRYWWLQMSTQVECEPGRTWQQLADLFAADLGQSISIPTFDTRFTVPDPRAFADSAISPAIAIDAIALSLGFRALLHLDDTIELQDDTDSGDIFDEYTEEGDFTYGCGTMEDNFSTIGSAGETAKLTPLAPISSEVVIVGPKAVNYVDCGSWDMIADIVGGSTDIEPLTVHTSHYWHELPSCDEDANHLSLSNLVAAIGTSRSRWRAPVGFLIAPSVRNWTGTSIIDYSCVHVSGSKSIFSSAITLPAEFFPRMNYSQWADNYIHTPSGSGWIIKTPEDGIDGLTGNVPGSAYCEIYQFQNDNPSSDASGNCSVPEEIDEENFVRAKTDAGNLTSKIPVYNLSKIDFPGSTFTPADTVKKKAVVYACLSEESESSASESASSISESASISESTSNSISDSVSESASSGSFSDSVGSSGPCESYEVWVSVQRIVWERVSGCDGTPRSDGPTTTPTAAGEIAVVCCDGNDLPTTGTTCMAGLFILEVVENLSATCDQGLQIIQNCVDPYPFQAGSPLLICEVPTGTTYIGYCCDHSPFSGPQPVTYIGSSVLLDPNGNPI